MPSLYTARRSKKHWRARCERDGIEYFLGYFLTKEEAIARERAFDEQWPPRVKQPRRNAEDPVKTPGQHRAKH